MYARDKLTFHTNTTHEHIVTTLLLYWNLMRDSKGLEDVRYFDATIIFLGQHSYINQVVTPIL